MLVVVGTGRRRAQKNGGECRRQAERALPRNRELRPGCGNLANGAVVRRDST